MLANRIGRQLHQQYGIIAPEDWTEACIEWIQQENQGEILPENQLFDLVYEQWLLSDLRELGSASLPPGLAQQKMATLRGIHCLQVDSIVDVSQPYYGQLQKVKGTENENVNVSATQQAQPVWESKTSRMLSLRMTDGVQNIQGMEYQPIQALSTQLSPGIKVRIQGPVLCRVGVLMLQASNIQVLGGEVEGLVAHNTQEILLTNALNAKEEVLQTTGKQEEKKVFNNNEGEGQRPLSSNERRTAPQARSSMLKQEYQAPVPGGAYRRGGSEGVNTLGKLEGLGTYNISQDTGPLHRIKSENTTSTDPFDDFPDDDILEAMPMDTMEPKVVTARKPQSWDASGTDQLTDEDHIAALMEDMPEEFLDTPGQDVLPTPHIPQVKPSRTLSSDRARLSTKDTDVFFTETELKKTKSNAGKSRSGSYQDSEEGLEVIKSGQPLLKNDDMPYIAKGCVSSTSMEPHDIKHKQEPADTDGCQISMTHKEYLSQLVGRHTCDNSVKPPAKRIKTEQDNCENMEFKKKSACVEHMDVITVSNESQSLASSTISKKLGVYSPPFTYLCFLRDTHPVKPSTFRVKAYISTLLSKLEYKTGYWSVVAKINDGSDSMDVDLGDEMLSELIGFSAKNCLKMKENLRTNPALKTKIMKGIKGCQESLIQLSCILELELSPFRVRPYVLQNQAIIKEDLDALAKRQ